MLYFSETDWTLPDMAEVSAAFDRDYDQNEYEHKIAVLIRNISADNQGHNPEEEEAWDNAVLKLTEGDHYLSVLTALNAGAYPTRSGFIPTLDRPAVRPPHDRLKLWLTAFGIVFGTFAVVVLGNWLFGPKFSGAMGWLFADRNRFDLLVLLVVFIGLAGQVLRPNLKGILSALLNRR